MFNWLTQWLKRPTTDTPLPAAEMADSPPVSAPTPATPGPAAAGPDPQAAPEHPPATPAAREQGDVFGFNVQTAAVRWVFGLDEVPAPPHALTLGHLAEIIERMSLDAGRAADWVPRVPAVLPALLRSLRDEHSSAHDLAHLLEQDVVLLAEALKEANSALFQRHAPVTQTEEAVQVLGSHGLRLLVARVAFRPVLSSDAGVLMRHGAARVWALGEACAEASRHLAAGRGVDPFEAFLAGLALNTGQLVALRMVDRVAHLSKPDPHGMGPRSVPVGEDTGLAASDHQAAQDVVAAMAILSHRVAARWELPENVVGTITGQIDAVARTYWPESSELLGVALEAARLRLLHEAGRLPGTLEDCSLHLPDDARQWLLSPTPGPATDT